MAKSVSDMQHPYQGVENTMYDTANKIVCLDGAGGFVGRSTNCLHSAIGDEYVECVIRAKTAPQLVEKWEAWIQAYIAFSKQIFHGRISKMTAAKPTIYWRLRPEIKLEQDLAMRDEWERSGVKPPHSVYTGGIVSYARLLISYA